jgi:iron complex outermembrane receptor protein
MLGVLALLGLSNAQAQSTPSAQTTQMLPTVQVMGDAHVGTLDDHVSSSSRLNLSLRETPASVEQIDGELIRDRGDVSVIEAVTRATGIVADGTPGDGGTALSARGFSGHNSVMQLFDGARMFVGAGTVTFPFDTWSTERIEVLRGPASVLNGEGAIGGVINVVPKKPNRMLQENEVLLSYGSQKTSQLAVDSIGPINQMLSYRISASSRDSDGYVDRGQSRSLAFSGALRLDVTPDLAITLSHDTGDQHPAKYFGAPLVNGQFNEAFRKANFNVGDAILQYRDQWTRVEAEWKISSAVNLTSTFSRLASQRHWKNAESYYWNAGLVDREDFLEILHNQTQFGNRTALNLNGDWFGQKNNAVVGFDLNNIRFQHDNNFAVSGSSTVNPNNFVPGSFIVPSGTVPAYKTRTRQAAVFAEDRLFLTKDWTLVGGLRSDHIDFHRDNLVNGSIYDKNFSATSWRVGTVYNLSPSLALYAQYATGSDPVGSIITLSPSRAVYDLSTGKQWEAGLKQSFAGQRGDLTLAAYRIVKDKLLTNAPNQPGVTLQVGQQSSRGLEATVNFSVGQGLDIYANATVLQARFDDFYDGLVSRSGNTPPDVAEAAANLGLNWKLAPAWQVGGDVRYVGKRYGDNANLNVLPSYTVVDARVQWQTHKNVNLALNLFNAFDKLYAAAPYNSGGQWILGRPRSVELSARLAF